jgi:hypothetical protein
VRGDTTDRAVALPASTLSQYRAFSLYNSPYAAHDEGRAIDLYPEHGHAPSPVAGDVRETRSVRAPPKEHAEEEDHLILLDVAPEDPVADGRELVARVLHVDPGVEPGDRVERGDDLGRTVRAGFFAPWVGDHLHVGFRPPGANPYRASGSLPLSPEVRVEPLDWNGTGTVVAHGPTYVILDRPAHPDPGEEFAGIAVAGADAPGGVLDGGFPHYDGGGVLPIRGDDAAPVSLFGTGIGTENGRSVEWRDRSVRIAAADASRAGGSGGEAATGLSFYAGRDRAGAKVICPDHGFTTGDRVRVWIE